MYHHIVVLTSIFAVAMMAPRVARDLYDLPDEADSILDGAQINKTFSCTGRMEGYYADTDNGCKIFHRCVPNVMSFTSYICNNETIFDQQELVCNYEMEAFPCDQAESIYDSSNARFTTLPPTTESANP
ncbi:U-scoloptoxin(01)-Er1a-like [Tachypleus tridentatus]|uniref:U-scoloptoxin(01)-Er1a-like n=1 Tax=Tachypleus tridentatus TaxID=6853 RepID=UPI003FD3A363